MSCKAFVKAFNLVKVLNSLKLIHEEADLQLRTTSSQWFEHDIQFCFKECIKHHQNGIDHFQYLLNKFNQLGNGLWKQK